MTAEGFNLSAEFELSTELELSSELELGAELLDGAFELETGCTAEPEADCTAELEKACATEESFSASYLSMTSCKESLDARSSCRRIL